MAVGSGETPTASAEEPASAPPSAPEPAAEAEEGVVGKIKKLFGDIF